MTGAPDFARPTPRWSARALPDFPWDALLPYAERAARHPDGPVDLSVGTPVDPSPDPTRAALAAASNAPGYPLTVGSEALRAAAAGWLRRRTGVAGAIALLPTIGSKEFVALLPSLLALDGAVQVPVLAYPTYAVGARLAGLAVVTERADDVALVWVNSPANPTGDVLSPADLAEVVAWGREHGALVVSDECYCEFGWEAEPVSVLHPDVCGGSHDGVLAVHSLSKRSNLAGYRIGLVAGDPAAIAALREVRRHAGLIVPAPVQAAAVAAFRDDEHVAAQRTRYASRRARLRPALESAGFTVEGSAAGLYLWATRREDCWASVGWLADHGILVAPGSFYGETGARHVRVGLTATDERVAAAVRRLVDHRPS